MMGATTIKSTKIITQSGRVEYDEDVAPIAGSLYTVDVVYLIEINNLRYISWEVEWV